MKTLFGKSKRGKKNPITILPLPDPGTSLQNESGRIGYEEVFPWIVTAAFSMIFAAAEWLRYFAIITLHPVFVSIGAIAICAFAAFRVIRMTPILQRLKLARQGERYVGQLFERKLRPIGYQVFHDVNCGTFNIDHVLIGPGGVFAVETKTISKSYADAHVSISDSQILVGGRQLDRDPIAQARAAARTVSKILLDYSGTTCDVKPTVVFPGWFVERQPERSELWVLNEKAFVAFVALESPKLNDERINVLSSALERYVRDQMKN